jgi:hypothetical protein
MSRYEFSLVVTEFELAQEQQRRVGRAVTAPVETEGLLFTRSVRHADLP